MTGSGRSGASICKVDRGPLQHAPQPFRHRLAVKTYDPCCDLVGQHAGREAAARATGFFLTEPRSGDGLVKWNVLDDVLGQR